MATLRLIVTDLVGTRLGEWIPLTEVSYGVDRDQPGTLTATVEARGTRPTGPVCLFVVAAGEVHWAGIVWTVTSAPSAGEPWEIKAATFDSTLAYATIRTSRTFKQFEQAVIVAQLIQYHLPPDELALWDLVMPYTGIKRDLTVDGAEADTISQTIFDMADNIDGFDLRFSGVLDSPKPRRAELLYPRDHRRRTTVAIRPGVRLLKWDEDWTWVANVVTASGDDGLSVTVQRPVKPGWPTMARSINFPGVKWSSTLRLKANRYLDEHAAPLLAAEVESTIGESMMGRVGEDVRVMDPSGHRDAVFQLVSVKATWLGESRVETMTLVQEEGSGA